MNDIGYVHASTEDQAKEGVVFEMKMNRQESS
jgi:hypothetical protein